MAICKGARLKIERADKHISDIELRVASLEKSLAVTAHVNPDIGYEFIKCDFKDVKDRDTAANKLAPILGDAIHNLKCALDHVWFETISRLVAGDWERFSKFPIYPTIDLLENELRKLKIDFFAHNFYNLIVTKIQPYDGGDFAIWTIHELDIRDKHRLLIPVSHYSSIGDIQVKDEHGDSHRGSTWATTNPLPFFVDFTKGLHIENPGSASLSIMFEYGNYGREMGMDILREFSHHVLRAVELLEEFVES